MSQSTSIGQKVDGAARAAMQQHQMGEPCDLVKLARDLFFGPQMVGLTFLGNPGLFQENLRRGEILFHLARGCDDRDEQS